MTSENIHSIPEQPSNTCPMIDDVGDYLDDIISEFIVPFDRLTHEELIDFVNTIESKLRDSRKKQYSWNSDHYPMLEDIRTNVIAIREWGQGWKELALEQHEKLEELKKILE